MSSTPATSRSPTSPRSRKPTATEARDLLARSRRDPVWFAANVLGVHLWSRQQQIVESVRDHQRTAVRSGHGVGKTMSAAVALLWFLYSFPESRVVSTATKWSQVEKLLWHEVGQLHAKARFPLGGDCLKTELNLPDGRYALGLSSKPENAESFQGHHAPHILVIYDEASGIPASIFEAGEGYMTTDGARMLMIGNPTRPQGEFFAAFHSKRAEYSTLSISALESPAVTGEDVPDVVKRSVTGQAWIDSRRRAWGVGSVLYQVRVEGKFPARASDAVIALSKIEDAQERDRPGNPARDRITIGVDVARFGDDETVIARRVGTEVRIVETYVGNPTTHTTGRVLAEVRKHPDVTTTVVVDDTGVGGGVTDQLREKLADTGVQVVAFNGAEQAYQPDDYPNRRSEHWFAADERMGELDLDDDEQLTADLSAPVYKFDSNGRRVVERKDETKKRLGRSPDRADAVLLTLVQQPVMHAPPPPTGTRPADAFPMDSRTSQTAGSLTADLNQEW